MNIERIQQEFRNAEKSFEYVELHPTYDGKVFVKAALVTGSGKDQIYTLSIKFPDEYPYEMPRVTIDTPSITNAPHQYREGNICYLHPSMWNPGAHNISFVLWRVAKWLNKYEVWRVTDAWPGKQILH